MSHSCRDEPVKYVTLNIAVQTIMAKPFLSCTDRSRPGYYLKAMNSKEMLETSSCRREHRKQCKKETTLLKGRYDDYLLNNIPFIFYLTRISNSKSINPKEMSSNSPGIKTSKAILFGPTWGLLGPYIVTGPGMNAFHWVLELELKPCTLPCRFTF